jgi:hypothetical protein
MKQYHEVVVVYPKDDSTFFLKPLLDILKNIYPKAIFSSPEPNTYGSDISDETDLIIFLGHGTPSQLCGSVDENGEKSTFLNINNGAILLDSTTVILFSCNSNDYLNKVRTNSDIDYFITFGDMPTDWEHIKHNRKINKNFLINFTDEHLEYYKSAIVESLVKGFQISYYTNSLVGIIKGLTLIINKKINEIILSKSWSNEVKFQMIELLNNFKKEIRYSQPL